MPQVSSAQREKDSLAAIARTDLRAVECSSESAPFPSHWTSFDAKRIWNCPTFSKSRVVAEIARPIHQTPRLVEDARRWSRGEKPHGSAERQQMWRIAGELNETI